MSDATIIRHHMSYVMERFRDDDNALLHGIRLEFMDGAWCPIIPHCGSLMDLAKEHPDCHEFLWIASELKWFVVYSNAYVGEKS